MSAIINFDANTVAPDQGAQDAIPAGWYNVLIDQSDVKPTKDGTGHFLEMRHKVMDGAYAGKYVYARLNLRNANPTAQEIGYKQLSAVCHAVGVLQVQDSAQLHNIPLKIKVKLRAASGEYEASNEISSWKNINEVVTQVAAAVAGGFPASPTPPTFTMPPPVAAAPVAPPAMGSPAAPPQWAPPQQPVAAAPQAPAGWAPGQAPQQPWAPPAQPAPPQAAPKYTPPVPPQAPMYAPPQAAAPVQQQPNPAAVAQAANPPWMQAAP